MSNTFSKPITSYTLNFQMPVRSMVEADMNYDDFCERFMKRRTLPPMNETDDEYERRCEEAWSKVVDAQRKNGYHEFPEGDDDEGEDELEYEIADYIGDLIETEDDEEYEALVEDERVKKIEARNQIVNKQMKAIIEAQDDYFNKVEQMKKALDEEQDKRMKAIENHFKNLLNE